MSTRKGERHKMLFSISRPVKRMGVVGLGLRFIRLRVSEEENIRGSWPRCGC